MTASLALKKQVKKASRDVIKEAVRRLRSNFPSGSWIGLRNIYARIYLIRPSEIINRRRDLRQKQIIDYIAASIFTHCSDGWSLLGKALGLQIKGDATSAVHLAYYAELRAGMSLLAAEGIGAFKSKHIVVTDTSLRSVITTGKSPTHKFVWDMLEYWADRKSSAETLAEVIRPGSISLSEWLNAFDVSVNLHPIGRSWLKLWGLDIKQFGDDQELRNHSSYRPSRILPKATLPARDVLSFSSELWHMCEPNPTSRFNELDKHLLRESLAEIYHSAIPPFVDPRIPLNTIDYRAWIESKITNLGFTPPIQNNWVDFLTWKIQANKSRILEEASKTTSLNDPSYHLQVVARATLLLRIATGISGRLLQEVGFSKNDLDFWWAPYAIDHGLVENVTSISDFLDLWADIDVALQDISTWEASHSVPYSYNQLVNDLPQQIFRLGECERISLWGLGI